MGKAMSIAGMIVGALVGVIFTMDAFLSVPFGGPAIGLRIPDIGLAVCGFILAYLAWSAFRQTA